MKPFAAKLFPPRPTFHLDMTDEERDVMSRHGTYWRELLEQKIAVVFGPVIASDGPWGLAVFYAEDQNAADAILAEDPAYKAGYKFEAYPMLALVH